MAKAKAKHAPEPEEDDDDDDDVEVAPRRWLVWIRRLITIKRGAYILTTLLFGTGTAGWYLPDIPVAGPLAQQVRTRLWSPSKTAAKKASSKGDAKGDSKTKASDEKTEAETSRRKAKSGADSTAPAAPATVDEMEAPTALPDSPIADVANDSAAALPSSEPLAQPAAPSFDEEPAIASSAESSSESPAEPAAASAAPTAQPTTASSSEIDPSLSQALSDTSSSSSNSASGRSATGTSSRSASGRSASAGAAPASGAGRRNRWGRSAPEATEAASAPEVAPDAAAEPGHTDTEAPVATTEEPSEPAHTPSARSTRVSPLLSQERSAAALPASPPSTTALPPSASPSSAAAMREARDPREGAENRVASTRAREPMTQPTATSATGMSSSGGVASSVAGGGPNRAANGRPDEMISIATFNIQVFGTAKLDNPDVTDKLVEIIRQFDIVAIQEIRSKEDNILPRFVRLINSTGRQYAFEIGPRLGRTSSKEQYAFLFDTQRVEVNRPSVGTIEDPSDLLHREPLIARFRSRLVPPDRAFTFYLANIHTDPDDVENEVDVLADVFEIMQQTPSGEDDVILLGDFNTDYRRLGRLGKRPNLFAVVEDTPTNARQNEAYDNILFDRQATSEFTGRWAVLDVQSWFRLSREEMLSISDHLPVWAMFSAWESTSPSNVSRRGVPASINGRGATPLR